MRFAVSVAICNTGETRSTTRAKAVRQVLSFGVVLGARSNHDKEALI